MVWLPCLLNRFFLLKVTIIVGILLQAMSPSFPVICSTVPSYLCKHCVNLLLDISERLKSKFSSRPPGVTRHCLRHGRADVVFLWRPKKLLFRIPPPPKKNVAKNLDSKKLSISNELLKIRWCWPIGRCSHVELI